MTKRLVLVTVSVAAFLALAGLLIVGTTAPASPPQSGMPVPRLEGIEEAIDVEENGGASLGMPAPGYEDVREMVVVGEEESGASSSGMPVPGLEGVEEHIVTPDDQGTVSSGMPVPGMTGVEEHIVIEQ